MPRPLHLAYAGIAQTLQAVANKIELVAVASSVREEPGVSGIVVDKALKEFRPHFLRALTD